MKSIMQNIVYTLLFCPPFCRKKNPLVHKLCLLLPRLSIGQVCEAGISLRFKKNASGPEFFIIFKIPVSKNATQIG